MLKRSFDFALACVSLLIASPLLALIALVIWRTMGRPILFTQQRPGLGGRPFRIFKFRTMRDVVDARGRLLPDSARLTFIGRLLRSTSLDELPELWNVLRGDMSLVGPRPLLMHYLPLYTRAQARRHLVRPGITGWAQVNGRNAISWERKFELDTWYVDHRSFWFDMRILALTILQLVRRQGINQPGYATVEYFTGPRENSE